MLLLLGMYVGTNCMPMYAKVTYVPVVASADCMQLHYCNITLPLLQ